MERSFQHKPKAEEGGLAMPHPHQFASTSPSASLRDRDRRRAYLESEEAVQISLDERLRQIAAAQDRDAALRRAEAVDWEAQLNRWSQSTGARREQNEEVYLGSDVDDAIEPEVSPWEASFEAEQARSLPYREHGGLSQGAYQRLAATDSPTNGDVRGHTGRLRLGQFRALDELKQQLRDLEARSAVFQQPHTDEPPTWSRREQRARDQAYEQLLASRASLARLQDSAEDSGINHKYRMVDAAYTRRGQPHRSHVEKPSKPRGDGRSIRAWDEE